MPYISHFFKYQNKMIISAKFKAIFPEYNAKFSSITLELNTNQMGPIQIVYSNAEIKRNPNNEFSMFVIPTISATI